MRVSSDGWNGELSTRDVPGVPVGPVVVAKDQLSRPLTMPWL